MAVDIGNDAADRAIADGHAGKTVVERGTPATSRGFVNEVEIWSGSGLTAPQVATFFVVAGNNLSTRTTETLPNVPGGSKQTFPVKLNVEVGDYIGIYLPDNGIETDLTGASIWEIGSDQIPCTNQAFTLTAGHMISLGGQIGAAELGLSGTVGTVSGGLVRKTSKSLHGSIYEFMIGGTLGKKIGKKAAGVLAAGNLSGTIESHRKFLQAVAGTCGNLAGSIVKKISKNLAGRFNSVDTVGATVMDRPAGSYMRYIVWAESTNPVLRSGTIIEVSMWLDYSIANCQVGTIYRVSGNLWSSRDYEDLGAVTGGSKQTFVVDLDAEPGDILAVVSTDALAQISSDLESGVAAYRGPIGGLSFPFSSEIMSWQEDITLSLGGVLETRCAIYGSISKKIFESLSGTVGTLSGSITKKTKKGLSGVVGTLTGSFSRAGSKFFRSLSGLISSITGALTAFKTEELTIELDTTTGLDIDLDTTTGLNISLDTTTGLEID